MNLAGYIRVSTEGQVDAFGKPVQIDALNRWATLNGHTIVEWFEEDGVSGKVDGGDRPELACIVARAGDFDGMVAFDATRIARRLHVQETLLNLVWAAGLKVFTTTAGELDPNDDDPTKIMIRQILGVIAEFDHRNTVKRLHAGRRAKAAAGGFAGGTPKFGLKVENGEFVLNDTEIATINTVRQLHGLGLSLREIAARLNDMGALTKTGKGVWHAQQVARLLQRAGDPTH